MAKRKRRIPIQIYLSEEEQALLQAKMKLTGIRSVSMYLRQMIRYGFVYEVDYAPIRQMNEHLGKLGGNINQIAKRANTTKNIYPEDIKEVKDLLKQIWLIQKSILSNQPFIKR